MPEAEQFKRCTTCGAIWLTREQWLADPSLTLVGYQVNFKALKTGVFMFNHSCRTTLGVYADSFADLYQGPVFRERATGTDQCPGHCLHKENLGPCPAQCECSYIRYVIEVIRNWPKNGQRAPEQNIK